MTHRVVHRAASSPVLSTPCARIAGAPSGYPVHWCQVGSPTGGLNQEVSVRWVSAQVRVGVARLRRRGEAGMTTAEYAVGTIAACAFGAVLLAVVRSGTVRSALAGVITTALGSGS